MSSDEIKLDRQRQERLGFAEAIFCLNKSAVQIEAILVQASRIGEPLLLTRLDEETAHQLPPAMLDAIEYDVASRTGFFQWAAQPKDARQAADVAIVTAGTSDAAIAREAGRTLEFHGVESSYCFDVGVAGLWRLLERVDDIRRHDVVIAVAGMDAALPSVLGGLVAQPIIAVPTSTGYGAARNGETALASCLTSCAPGVLVTNIDNGYGAACAALRILRNSSEGWRD